MLRVTHLITDLDRAGAETMLARLVESTRGEAVAHSVVSLTTIGPIGDRIARAGVPVESLGLTRTPNPFVVARLVRILRRLKPDVLQTWLYHADLLGAVAGRLSGVPNIVWNIRCGRLDPRDHPRTLVPMLRVLAWMSRVPAAVVCNSRDGRVAHEELGYTPRRWEILPNGFDTAGFRPSDEAGAVLRRDLHVGAGTKLVGLLARYHPMKDHETFLRAAAIVARARDDVHFVAVGRQVDRAPSLADAIEKLAIKSRVTLGPEIADPAAFLGGLDVAVSASYGEAFPNVVGEAMACGTPCVATDVGESAAIVGEAGIVVPPSNPAAMAAAIERLLDLDAPRRRELGEAARRRIVSEFSLERVAARYMQLYEELTSRSARPSDVPICAE